MNKFTLNEHLSDTIFDFEFMVAGNQTAKTFGKKIEDITNRKNGQKQKRIKTKVPNLLKGSELLFLP